MSFADENTPPRDRMPSLSPEAPEPAETEVFDGPESHTEAEARFTALIESDAPPQELAREVEAQEPADAADSLELLEPEESAEVLKRMEEEAAAEALSHMDVPLAVTVLEDLPPGEAGTYLALMDADDAADLLQAMPKDEAQAVLQAMPRHIAARLAKLALYDPETAGGQMNIEFLALPADATVADAVEIIREHPEDLDYPEIYVVDDEMRLVGEVELRDLLVNPAKSRLREIMDADVDSVLPSLDRETVAMEFDRYDYLTLPVVDENRRLLGIVTIDDVIDIIRKEHSEDVFKQVGVGRAESVHDPLSVKIRGRFPWLMINLLTSQVAAVIVLFFDNLFLALPLLAAIMGMIANQAGNAGQQSLAVTMRGLVLGQIHKGRSGKLLAREVALGAVSGVFLGAMLGLAIALLGAVIEGLDWRVGVIAGVAMAGSITMGCLAGVGMPVLLHHRGYDPATGSTIFLTMTTDSISFLTFLGLAFLLKSWLLGG